MSSSTLKKKSVKIFSANKTSKHLIVEAGEFLKQKKTVCKKSPRFIIRDNSGKSIKLAKPLVDALDTVVEILLEGDAVSILPVDKILTTQEAADLLNVSRPYFISLLDKEKIPFTRTGGHRRIKYSDLLKYKSRLDKERKKKLDELSQMSQELGFYD